MRTVYSKCWLATGSVRQMKPTIALFLGLTSFALGISPSIRAKEFDPFETAAATPEDEDPFEVFQVAAPLDESAYYPEQPALLSEQISYQIVQQPAATAAQPAASQPGAQPGMRSDDPCAAATEKPLAALGINIALPSGELPADHASLCWDSINQTLGPLAAARYWHGQLYFWDATALCHRPLYFEEINLERYGYGCCACLQPAASAAHFFGTVPALPYCMAAECPCECVYTLGHYRPGSCPPWRCHWPPSDPLAAAAEGGFMTGMIFLIP
jgi:hypothetical protein